MSNPIPSLKERQENEFEVIKAIFSEDVKEVERVNENEEIPEMNIRIYPQRGSSFVNQKEHHTLIDLNVKIPPNYPNVAPQLLILEAKGIPHSEIHELNLKLENFAKKKLGEVMIYDLIKFAEEFLYEHQKEPTGSFYDEMLLRNKILEEQERKIKQEIQEKEIMAVKEEVLRKREVLKEETRLMKEQWKFQQGNSSPPSLSSSPILSDPFLSSYKMARKKRSSVSRRRSTSEGSETSTSDTSDVLTIDFLSNKILRKIQRGEYLGESQRGSTVHAGMDMKTGSLVAVTEWKFVIPMKNDKRGKSIVEFGGGDPTTNADSFLKIVGTFEPEFNLIQKLEHSNIILYYGMKTVQIDNGSFVIYIAEQFCSGQTLEFYMNDSFVMELREVRHCAKGILEALAYLHSNNIVHRFLRGTSVILDTKGEVKVGDYGLERKLSELYTSISGNEVEDKFAPSIGRGAKKGDVYRAGILLLSLILGKHVKKNPPTIPTSIPSHIQDFFNKCLTSDEQSRWTAIQLLEHSFIKMEVPKGPFLNRHKLSAEGFVCPKNENLERELVTQTFPYLSQTTVGPSRLNNDFQILQWLGKGGFGDVLKVKNKLDGGIYALKRIRLNPRNIQLNKKITREVKLLSQLNHENVVRYYNSWFETVVDTEQESESSLGSPTDPNISNAIEDNPKGINIPKKNNHRNSLGLVDRVEELAPSFQPSQSNDNGRTESEESDDEDIFGNSFLCFNEDSSDGIVFETSQSPTNESSAEDKINEEKSKEDGGINIIREVQFMYIQMEFCEKSTLRTAIDEGLWKEGDRVWRLFREIVEGLAHIHQQGMIHRDLKPVNIFLDSNDHVKIGDFGLATTKGTIVTIALTNVNSKIENPFVNDLNKQDSTDFESMTSQIGTALYVAPELITSEGVKTMYNQKVDIFSLGIIFFEMFYRALPTAMERARILTAIRHKQINLPNDVMSYFTSQQIKLINWLLDHDPSKRPSSAELLQSDYLPLSMEETELQDSLRHTLAKPESEAYKFLISTCFQQRGSLAEHATYDMELSRFKHHSSQSNTRRVKKVIERIFESHGGVELRTNLLMPKSPLLAEPDGTVRLMSRSGSLVSLPFDLRLPFARHVVWNGITNMRRWTIEKVYRERKVPGFHPRELWECAFDVVSMQKRGYLVEVELLSIVFEIIKDIPWLKDKNYTIRLGHTFLLEGLLIHYKIDEKLHDEIKKILSDLKNERNSKWQVQTLLVSLCLPDQFIAMLFNLIELEGPLSKVSSLLTGIGKRKGIGSGMIKEGLHHLQILSDLILSFGIKCEILIAPTMSFGTRVYSGLIFQVVCNLKKRKMPAAFDIIAAGGNYDSLLHNFSSSLKMTGSAVSLHSIHGVGMSISLDKLLVGIEEEHLFGNIDVLISSLEGHNDILKEKINLLKELWALRLKCCFVEGNESLEDVEEQSREIGATFIIILTETDILSGLLRLRFWEKDRFQEKKLKKGEAIEFVLKNRRGDNFDSLESSNGPISKAEQRTLEGNLSSVSLPTLNISLLIQDKEKFGVKKRYEYQMMQHIGEIIPKFSRGQTVELLGTELNCSQIKLFASNLDLDDREEFQKSVQELLEKYGRQKYLKSVCDSIYEWRFEKNSSVLILYGLIDNSFRLFI